MFDNELTPAQQYNLEKLLGRTAIDRTAVILDIFAQNAHTLEGKAQVELALLRYRLPRLRRGASAAYTRQTGGIGTRLRGSGETKLEVDRRRIKSRISKLEARAARPAAAPASSSAAPGAAAGSRTSRSSATPMPGSPRCSTGSPMPACWWRTACSPRSTPPPGGWPLPGGEPVLLTDTVGFVQRLPHGLVEAFKSTLETVAEADLLVHVVDASAPDPQIQIDAVRTVLAEIGAQAVPELLVFNKADLAPEEAARLPKLHPGSVAVSALDGEGIDGFLQTLSDRLRALANVVELLVPYERGDVLAAVHREGEVVSTAHTDDGVRVRARLDEAAAGRSGRVRRRVTGRSAAPRAGAVRADSGHHDRSSGLRAPALPLRPPRSAEARRGRLRGWGGRPVDRHAV